MADPRITVYIASHNYGRFLQEAIESVLRQTVRDWELLVIDDGSSDNTQDIIGYYRNDPRIRCYRTEGIGLPAVCNLALKEARGKYLVRLDGDDVFDENILLVLGNCLDQHDGVALVFPDYFLIDEHGEVFAYERRRRIYHANHMLDLPPNGACTMIRTDLLRQLGGYREDLGAQDGFDLWSRIRSQHGSMNINLPLFYYRRHGANLTDRKYHILNARRRIKKDAILSDIVRFRPFVGIIPCRRNYDFRPDLWRAELNGKSLLHRSLETALKSAILDYVVVACDNSDAEEEISTFRDPRLRFFQREPDDTIRSRSIVSTLGKISSLYDPQASGVTVLSYIQSPMVTTESLEEAIFTLIMNDADSSVAVEEIRNQLFRRTAHGLETINPPREVASDFDVVYREVKTVLATRNRNFRNGSLTGSAIVNFIVSNEESFFINSQRDFDVASAMLADIESRRTRDETDSITVRDPSVSA